MNKQTLITIAVVAVVILGSVYVGTLLNPPQPVQVQQPDKLSAYSPYAVGAEVCQNDLCTYVASGTFKDATSTIVSFGNPYMGSATATAATQPSRATSTIDLVQLIQTGVATSTIRIKCGVSTAAGYLSSSNNLVIDTGDIATSTNFGLIQSGIVNPTGYSILTQGIAFNSAASSSVAFGPGQYFVCKVTDPNGKDPKNVNQGASTYDGVSGVGNTFDGKFRIRIIKGY